MITGRRRGEVSALRWQHIDFERGQLIIASSCVHVRGGVLEKETKSGSQPRVALDPHTLSLLAEHRDRAVERCDLLGIDLAGDVYVFSLSPDDSTFYTPNSISQRYRRLAKAQQLRSTRFHALRHSLGDRVDRRRRRRAHRGRAARSRSVCCATKAWSTWHAAGPMLVTRA
jgi:integrase